MSEKIQDTVHSSIDTYAVALSCLRCGSFRDAEQFFSECVNKQPTDAIAKLGLLGVKLRSAHFVDYVLGLCDDSNVSTIKYELVNENISMISMLFSELEGEVLARFTFAVDLYLSVILMDDTFHPVAYASIQRVLPGRHPFDGQYLNALEFVRALPKVKKHLSLQALDEVASRVLDWLLHGESKLALISRVADCFKEQIGKKENARKLAVRWYRRVAEVADVDDKTIVACAEALTEMGHGHDAKALYSELLRRSPGNLTAEYGILVSSMLRNLEEKNLVALDQEADRIRELVAKINMKNSGLLKNLAKHLCSVATANWEEKKSFPLYDIVINRMFTLHKGMYCNACVELANLYLSDGIFDGAKFYIENALPHAAKNQHELYFSLLLISLGCRTQQEMLESDSFHKGMEEYKALLYSVRENPEQLKKYTKLADDCLQAQVVRKDARDLLVLFAAQEALDKKENARSVKASKTLKWLELLLCALGIALYFIVPYAYTSDYVFCVIPLAACIILCIYGCATFSSGRLAALSANLSKKCITGLRADYERIRNNCVGYLVISLVFLAITFFSGCIGKASDGYDGFGHGFYYSKNENGIVIEAVKNEKEEDLTIPATIKGVEVYHVDASALKSYDGFVGYIVPDGSVTLPTSNISNIGQIRYLVVPDTVEDISSYKLSSVTFLCYAGDSEKWKSIGGHEFVESNSSVEVLFYEKDEPTFMTTAYWHYDVLGDPCRWYSSSLSAVENFFDTVFEEVFQ